MPTRRAFIVAIENYRKSDTLATSLPGTHKAAKDFREWLIKDQGLTDKNIYFCTEDASVEGRTADATKGDIVGELARLQKDGKDKTDELYFFYSGHGFCYTDVDNAPLADVLVGADFKDKATSGNECLKLDEIQRWLSLCMGSRSSDHFYFIDACRNNTSEREIKVGSLGLAYDNSALGIPTIHTLYSTSKGALASAESGFNRVLLEGLRGTGRAKVWREGEKEMEVRFSSVKDYVEKKLSGQQIDERKEGSRKGVIREISPPPNYTCQMEVTNAAPTDAFRVNVTTVRDRRVASVKFVGPRGSFKQTPDDYNISVKLANFAVEPIDPIPADLYEDQTVRFEKRPVPAGGAAPAGPPPPLDSLTAVTIQTPDLANVVVRSMERGDERKGAGRFKEYLARGRYQLRTMDDRGRVVGRQTIDVPGAGEMDLDLSGFLTSPLRTSLLTGIKGYHLQGAIDMSETLGPTPDQGLDLWLAVIGASRIVGKPGEFSKLGPLPLTTFHEEPPGAAPVYLLAGFDRAPKRLAVGASEGPKAELTDLAPHPQFPGLFEWRSKHSKPGYQLLSLKVDEKATTTVAVCALPNRVTLVAVSLDARGALRIQQFMLPIHHLMHRLSPRVGSFFASHQDYENAPFKDIGTPLKSVRRMVEIQRQFAASKDLTAVLAAAELGNLLYMKWFEPIIALLAAYELARRGVKDSLPVVVKNLREFFPEIPDTEALAKMAGLKWKMPEHPPIVLDGALAINMPAKQWPLPPAALDFRGPWTLWKGA